MPQDQLNFNSEGTESNGNQQEINQFNSFPLYPSVPSLSFFPISNFPQQIHPPNDSLGLFNDSPGVNSVTESNTSLQLNFSQNLNVEKGKNPFLHNDPQDQKLREIETEDVQTAADPFDVSEKYTFQSQFDLNGMKSYSQPLATSSFPELTNNQSYPYMFDYSVMNNEGVFNYPNIPQNPYPPWFSNQSIQNQMGDSISPSLSPNPFEIHENHLHRNPSQLKTTELNDVTTHINNNNHFSRSNENEGEELNDPSNRFYIEDEPIPIQRKSYKGENRCLLPNPMVVRFNHGDSSDESVEGIVSVFLVDKNGVELPEKQKEMYIVRKEKGTIKDMTIPLKNGKAKLSLKLNTISDGQSWRLMFKIEYKLIKLGKIQECIEKVVSKQFVVHSKTKNDNRGQSRGKKRETVVQDAGETEEEFAHINTKVRTRSMSKKENDDPS
eukprot:TRINITY_DN3191_c0_g1_i2.p1 TRINITY_DN3191_c0_g1~~TRINITY_DN3191_c0_g1_i2.p1  ORF type:complete len:439 (-),score=121.16 TRINITY_DN3191_c0_g1_i2:193-1509(-)